MTQAGPRLVVGLGNPGSRYAGNRHNIGFMVLDALAARRGLAFAPLGEVGLLAVDGDLHLLKPLCYMNLSGEAVVAWSDLTGVPVTGRSVPATPDAASDSISDPISDPMSDPISDPISDPASDPMSDPTSGLRPLVVCDDLALPLGSVRLRERGSSGGQNGLASVIAHLGGEEFPRLRLGVAPLDGPVDPADWPDYVLADFAPGQAAEVADLVDHAVAAIEAWLAEGLAVAISRHNRRIRPPAD